jgi:hypothetical protein
VIVYGLRAGWTLKEIISHEDIKKNTFKAVLKRKIGELFATGGSADVLITRRKVYKRLSDYMTDYSLSDYFVSGVSELQVNAKPHDKIEDLIQRMKAVMGSLDRDTVAKAC